MERHRLDVLSLAFGLLFAVAGLLLVGGRPAAIDVLPLPWIGPLFAVGFGVLLIVAARPQRPAGMADESAEARDSELA
jgi:hypothetical protein